MSGRSAVFVFLYLVIAASLVTLSGCGGGTGAQTPSLPVPTGPASGSEFLYVNYNSGPSQPFFPPDYDSNGSSLEVASLTPTSGALSSLTSAVPPGDPNIFGDMNIPVNMTSIFSPPGGKQVYFASDLGDSGGTYGTALLGFSIGDKGQLTPITGDFPFLPQPVIGGVTGAAMDGLGKYIYISSYTDALVNQITAFALNASSGGITEGPVLSDTSAEELTVQASDASGTHLYAWHNYPNGNLGISVYQIDGSTGALAEISGSPFSVATGSSDGSLGANYLQFVGLQLVFSPSGNFAYAGVLNYTNFLTGGTSELDLHALSADPTTGALTELAGYPMSLGSNLLGGMAMHPNGRFLYASLDSQVSSEPGQGISILAVNPTTGTVASTPVSFVADAYCCRALLMDPSGGVLLDEGAGWHSFTIDSSTGLLTSAGTLTTADGVGAGLSDDSGPAVISKIP
jgi:hypothetical protein